MIQAFSSRLRALAYRCLLYLVSLVCLAWFAWGPATAPRSQASGKRQTLTFEDRVAAQRAIEAVYHRQRIWPKDNPQPNPALDEVLPAAALRAKVEEYLRMSRALEVFTGAALTPEQLQAELDRMARQTRQPEVLGALWAALNHDPLLLAECLARPVVAERELRLRMADCGLRIGGCEAFGLTDSSNPQSAIHHPQFEEWWRGVRGALDVAVDAPGWAYRLPEIAAVAVPCGSDEWKATNLTGAPITSSTRFLHTAVWTDSEMIIWGGENGSNTGGRYNPATDSWTTTTDRCINRFTFSTIQARSRKKRLNQIRSSADALECQMQLIRKMMKVKTAAVAQLHMLEVLPRPFIGIEVWRVGGEAFQVNRFTPTVRQKLFDFVRPVNAIEFKIKNFENSGKMSFLN